MPLYDFKCSGCGITEEIFIRSFRDKDKVKCATCGKKMDSIITITAKPVVFDYKCPYSGGHYTGPADRERKLKAKGYAIL